MKSSTFGFYCLSILLITYQLHGDDGGKTEKTAAHALVVMRVISEC